MKNQFVFSSLMLAAGMIPHAGFAQENCSNVNISPSTTCVLPQNGQGTLYTMVYRIGIADAGVNSCRLIRTSGNPGWQYPSYLSAYTNENNPGHQPREYWMAKREEANADYIVTNSPSTFVCVRGIGLSQAGALSSEIAYDFANNGSSSSAIPFPYTVDSGQIAAQLCSARLGAGAITATELATINNACGNPGTVLPVKLIGFSARENDGKATLSWETASEINFDRFDVERSSDGHSFSTAAIVFAAGQGGSGNRYTYNDSGVALNGTVYYRLKMIDLDGRVEYSAVLSLRFGQKAASQTLYPNPVTGSQASTLAIRSSSAQRVTISIHNRAGSLIDNRPVQLVAGTQVITVAQGSELRPGQYVVTVRAQSGETTTHKLIVQ